MSLLCTLVGLWCTAPTLTAAEFSSIYGHAPRTAAEICADYDGDARTRCEKSAVAGVFQEVDTRQPKTSIKIENMGNGDFPGGDNCYISFGDENFFAGMPVKDTVEFEGQKVTASSASILLGPRGSYTQIAPRLHDKMLFACTRAGSYVLIGSE